jgi:HEAT repeat protein
VPLVRKDRAPVHGAPSSSALLTAESADARWSAARALGSGPGDVEALGAALATEPDARVREAILTSLARTGGGDAWDIIAPYLRSDDAQIRTGAMDALGAMPQALLARLPDLLRDADPDVRILCCELARRIPAEAAERLLAEVIQQDPEVNVCAAAVEVLAEIGGRGALPALSACAARFAEEPFLVFSIHAAIERIAAEAPGARG